MANALDTFIDTPGVVLSDHLSDSGHAWTLDSGAQTALISNANRVRHNGSAGAIIYGSAVVPASANYMVSVDLHFLSAQSWIGVGVRTNGTTGLFVLLTGTLLYPMNNIGTPFGGTVTVSHDVGSTHNLKLVVVDYDATYQDMCIYWDNVLVKALLSVAGPTGVGKAAIYIDGAASDTAGVHIDNFSTTELVPGDAHAIGINDLLDNSYNNVDAPRQSMCARVKFTSDSPFAWLGGSTNHAPPTTFGLGQWVNGERANENTRQSFPSSPRTFFIPTPTIGAVNTFEFCGGVQSVGTYGSLLESVSVIFGCSLDFLHPVPVWRVVFYGDSTISGQGATYPGVQNFIPNLRISYARSVMVEGWGGRRLYDDAATEGQRTAFAQRLAGDSPKVIVISIGTNDWGMGGWANAAAFGAAYADLLDKIHAATPFALIIVQSPLYRSNQDVPDAHGEILQDYRDEIEAATVTRDFTTFVDGLTMIAPSGFADGVHPNTAGYAEYNTNIDPILTAALAAYDCPSGNSLVFDGF